MRRVAWMLLGEDGWPQRRFDIAIVTTDPRVAEEWIESYGDDCVAKVSWSVG